MLIGSSRSSFLQCQCEAITTREVPSYDSRFTAAPATGPSQSCPTGGAHHLEHRGYRVRWRPTLRGFRQFAATLWSGASSTPTASSTASATASSTPTDAAANLPAAAGVRLSRLQPEATAGAGFCPADGHGRLRGWHLLPRPTGLRAL